MRHLDRPADRRLDRVGPAGEVRPDEHLVQPLPRARRVVSGRQALPLVDAIKTLLRGVWSGTDVVLLTGWFHTS